MLSSDVKPAYRLPMLLLGMVALVSGVLAGLARLSVAVPALAQSQAAGHGTLMIAAFLGTVICLERAVALARGWPYLAPALAGVGGVALLAGAPHAFSGVAFVLAGLVLVAASVAVVQRQAALHTATLGLGAVAWLAGNITWLATEDAGRAAPLWMAFLVLTIAGERLELTRFMPTPPIARRLFVALLALLFAGLALAAVGEAAGLRLFSAALLGLAVWLLRFDIARKTVRQAGLTRYIAICLLAGYAWLALSGVLGLAGAFEPGHEWRDGALHALLLGFVFSMIFGHAPIIFPAVMRVKIPYHAVLYAPLALLHLSLAGRVAGSLLGNWPLRQLSAVANALALALFIVTLLSRVWRGRQPGQSHTQTPPNPNRQAK